MNSVYETIFKEFDTDSSASISRGEFLAGLDKLNTTLELTERQKIRLSLAADKNKDDKIDLNEFTEFLTNTVAQVPTPTSLVFSHGDIWNRSQKQRG